MSSSSTVKSLGASEDTGCVDNIGSHVNGAVQRLPAPTADTTEYAKIHRACLEIERFDAGASENVEFNCVGKCIIRLRGGLSSYVLAHKQKFKSLCLALAVILFNAYLLFGVWRAASSEDMDWCGGVGFLLILTGITYWSVLYYVIVKPYFGKGIQKAVARRQRGESGTRRRRGSHVLQALAFIAAVVFIIVDGYEQPKRLISACGVFAILAFGLLISKHPDKVKWDQIFWGIFQQFSFGLIVLRWESGRNAFQCLGNKVKVFLEFTDNGTALVYGYLATGKIVKDDFTVIEVQTIFFFKALSVIFFFSFCISILYYYGIMMWVITKLGWMLQISLGTTAAESMNAAANIFVGMNEAPLLIKPFIKDMTKSELHAVMTGGFATIAGSVMGAFISFGVNSLYLLSASIMAAPAALTMSKLIYPETEKSKTTAKHMKSITLTTADSALDAAAQGATQGVLLIGNIAANVIAFLAFISFLNAIFAWAGSIVGFDDLTFEWLLGQLFIPLAYIAGVDAAEVKDVALLLGLKTVVNEFVAYQKLTSEMNHLSARSKAIATYALCSFANFSAIGIQLGGIGFMAPERRGDLVQVIWYAFISGSVCGLLNACLAGALINEQELMLLAMDSVHEAVDKYMSRLIDNVTQTKSTQV